MILMNASSIISRSGCGRSPTQPVALMSFSFSVLNSRAGNLQVTTVDSVVWISGPSRLTIVTC